MNYHFYCHLWVVHWNWNLDIAFWIVSQECRIGAPLLNMCGGGLNAIRCPNTNKQDGRLSQLRSQQKIFKQAKRVRSRMFFCCLEEAATKLLKLLLALSCSSPAGAWKLGCWTMLELRPSLSANIKDHDYANLDGLVHFCIVPCRDIAMNILQRGCFLQNIETCG